MKKIIIIFLIILIAITAVILQQNIYNHKETPPISKVVIPKKSIDFTIKRDGSNKIGFIGTFSDEKTPKEFAKILKSYRIEHEIKINPKLTTNQESILIVKKIIKILVDSYDSWSIVYKNRKLLVSGKTSNIEAKERVETLLELSTINSFSNIEFIKEPSIISQLKDIVSKEQETTQKDTQTPTKEEAIDILSSLKAVSPQKEIFKQATIKKRKITKIKKMEKVKPSKIKRVKKLIKRDNPIKEELSAKEYQEMLNKEQPSPDILSLPPVETVDMNIEEKIAKGIIPPLKTSKPVVEKETIYIPSKEKKIDDTILWAELHDMDERVDGILIKENIN